ncbi:glycosyltransferase family 2 protein [bacterium]|nr:glycosyltransferase family 2 protein [bacterium]
MDTPFKLSIIIPCYNVGEYIGNTLDSILKQTDKSWEVIAVDDGSTDNTLDILHSFSKDNSRIKVITQNNSGVSIARNEGLKLATGNYVYFLDGDDTIATNLVEEVNQYVHHRHSDIILFGFKEQKSPSKERIHLPKSNKKQTLLNKFLTNQQLIHICSCVFNREFIINQNIIFDRATSFSEDREFISLSLDKADSIGIIRKVLYTYLYRETSAMRRNLYDIRKLSSVIANERMYNYFKYTDYRASSLIQLQTTIILHLRQIVHGCQVNPEIQTILEHKATTYLSLPTPLCLHRDSLFSFILSKLYHFPLIFNTIIRKI